MRSKLKLMYREPEDGEHVVGPVIHVLAWERICNTPGFESIAPLAWAVEEDETEAKKRERAIWLKAITEIPEVSLPPRWRERGRRKKES